MRDNKTLYSRIASAKLLPAYCNAKNDDPLRIEELEGYILILSLPLFLSFYLSYELIDLLALKREQSSGG